MKPRFKFAALLCTAFLAGVSHESVPLQAADPPSFLSRFSAIETVASTIPPNGDLNPYGVAVITRSTGSLVRGNILVSNFNNSTSPAGLQGTGTTIMQISPDGTASLFAQLDPSSLTSIAPDGIGLTTALVVLRSGWVIVGSLPTADGTSATAKAGSLLVLNDQGQVVESIGGPLINGPWDMTAFDGGDWAVLFVTNVLNGTVAQSPNEVDQGTVVRIRLSLPDMDSDSDADMPAVESETTIGSGFAEKTDPAALVIGPTGVGLGHDGVLYVADTLNNRIQAIPDALFRPGSAGQGDTVSSGGALNGPLGMAVAPNGHILVVNGGDGNMVEVAPDGTQVDVMSVDITQTGAGSLFGLALSKDHRDIYFVNDSSNTLDVLERKDK